MLRLTLDEAARKLRGARINPLDPKNKCLARDLNYLLACSNGARYDAMAFRAVTLNVTNIQRRGTPFFYCATIQRMRLCGVNVKQIKWHADDVVNDHSIPLHYQYTM